MGHGAQSRSGSGVAQRRAVFVFVPAAQHPAFRRAALQNKGQDHPVIRSLLAELDGRNPPAFPKNALRACPHSLSQPRIRRCAHQGEIAVPVVDFVSDGHVIRSGAGARAPSLVAGVAGPQTLYRPGEMRMSSRRPHPDRPEYQSRAELTHTQTMPRFETVGGAPQSGLEKALSYFADVRAGEGRGVLLLTLNVFLLLFAYYLLKTVREALILTEGGAYIKAYSSAG